MSFHDRSFTIAGAGLSGTSVFAMALRDLQTQFEQAHDESFPSVSALIADISNDIGPGGPYSHKSVIYLLNQPAYAMSPFPGDTGHFVDWLQEKNPDVDRRELENSFQSRATYGAFLRDVHKKTVESVQHHIGLKAHLSIEAINGAVNYDGITPDAINFSTRSQNWQTNALVVADGHFQNEYLSEFSSEKGYFDSTITRDELNDLDNNYGRVLIVGSGQTMLDRLAELDHYGYEGQIDIASRRGVLPWVFDPELYRDDRNIKAYELKFFTLEAVNSDRPFSYFKNLWDEEIQNAQKTGYGIGHVLGQFFSNKNFKDLEQNHPNPNVWSQMLDHIKAVYGNPTPKIRYDMLQSYQQSGQLTSRQASIGASNLARDFNGFTVDYRQGNVVHYDAVINSASCARGLKRADGSIRSSLITGLDQDTLINWDPLHNGIILPGQQADPRIFYAGPYSHPSRWGCESFRDKNQLIAQTIIKQILSRNI